jgi:hypothetical protein
MLRVLDPFRFVLIAVAGRMNQHQLQIIDYLREENRVLREQLGACSQGRERAQKLWFSRTATSVRADSDDVNGPFRRDVNKVGA